MRFEKPPQDSSEDDDPPQNGIPEIVTSDSVKAKVLSILNSELDSDHNESEVFDRKTSKNFSMQHDSCGIDLHTEGK